MIGKIVRLGKDETKNGRLGEYHTQGLMLDLTGDDGVRQSVYGTLFGQSVDMAKALNLQFGDRVEVETVFTTSERNGFVSNYVEFRNLRKL